MLIGLIVATTLCAEPSLTDAELATAPVATLGLRDLLREDARLGLEEPSRRPGITLIALGLVCTAAAAGFSYAAWSVAQSAQHPDPDSWVVISPGAMLGFAVVCVIEAVAFLGSGVVSSIFGGRVLADLSGEHAAWEERRAQWRRDSSSSTRHPPDDGVAKKRRSCRQPQPIGGRGGVPREEAARSARSGRRLSVSTHRSR